MSEELSAIKAELVSLTQQMVGVSEHRSRLMVLLTERSREIADLTTELVRVKTDGLRYLEEAQRATRQLRRANDRLVELTSTKQSLASEQSQLHDELETLRWELASVRNAANTADTGLNSALVELSKLRQELDAARRTLEARNVAWEQEREQLKMTVSGLSLEIQSEHQAARVLERQWVLTEPKFDARLRGKNNRTEPNAELLELREERRRLSDRLRELERDAGATLELEKLQQELRSIQVERQSLERRLEDAIRRDEERETLRSSLKDVQQQLRETDGLRAEVERLRAKLYKTPLTSGTYHVGTPGEPPSVGTVAPRDLGSELTEFAQRIDARSAVVADGLGFPVATTGSTVDGERLAAVAGEADRLSTQARQILGLSEVTQLTVEDRDGIIAHFRYFAVEDNIMSIVTLGSQVPVKEDLDRIVGLTRHTLTVPRGRGAQATAHVDHRPSMTVARPSGVQATKGLVTDLKAESR